MRMAHLGFLTLSVLKGKKLMVKLEVNRIRGWNLFQLVKHMSFIILMLLVLGLKLGLVSYFVRRMMGILPRGEKALEHCCEEGRKEDFNSFNLQAVLHTKDPIEDQCRRLYTITMFKVFRKELLECYSYFGIKINVEGAISRYLVQKCGNGDERNTVAFNASNLNISSSCKMFEFEGMLCRHALKVFQIMNIRELPSLYILHRWTKDAKCGILRDVDSRSQHWSSLIEITTTGDCFPQSEVCIWGE